MASLAGGPGRWVSGPIFQVFDGYTNDLLALPFRKNPFEQCDVLRDMETLFTRRSWTSRLDLFFDQVSR